MALLEEYSQCDDDELREFCIQACEAFVQRCPEAIGVHIPLVIEHRMIFSIDLTLIIKMNCFKFRSSNYV